tara:strand:- start:11783 stop:12757 length:975 start_codon:yes stop_codon:yes gene_type:complete
MNQLIFAVNNLCAGSTILRAQQIKEYFFIHNTTFKEEQLQISILEKTKISMNIQNAIVIWIGGIGKDFIPKMHKSNIHILDIVDKYLYDKKNIDLCISRKFFQAVIVNNTFMKDLFSKKVETFVIYHHWDPRFGKTQTICDNLTFGYMGSIKSLLHTNNFLHYKKLIHKYPIKFFETELGIDVTDKVMNDKINYKISYTQNNIPEKVNFICDINIREINSQVAKLKTTAKIATAASLGHNIITTFDASVKDILPKDYPFILYKTDFESVSAMFDLVVKDFNEDKVLWNKGLKIMEEVKIHLSMKNIIQDYESILIKKFKYFKSI